MINHYKFQEQEFLGYNDTPVEWPDYFKVETIAEDINPFDENLCKLPIYKISNLLSFLRRTSDRILEEEHLISWDSICLAYFLLRQKKLNKPRRIRELVLSKYTEVLSFINPKYECTTEMILKSKISEEQKTT